MRLIHLPLLAPIAAIPLSLALPAQDLLGVTWSGATVLVDSHSGAVRPLGTGLAGQNSLARANDGTFWSTRRLTSTLYSYTRIDPATGSATPIYSGYDIRGLTTGPGTTLYGIRDAPVATDLLVQFDTVGGFTSTVGSTGFADIQGLAMHQGVLYAWDVFQGLLIVDPATGAATDPFPGVSGPAYQQSLCSHPDGRLLLGGGDSNGTDQLYSVDVRDGLTTLIGLMTGAVDVRGLEPIGGFATWFGQGCSGTNGPVSLSVTGLFESGGSLTSASNHHAPNAVGAVLIGFSNTAFGSWPLPLLLDPLLGTSGCSLLVSIDADVAGITGPAAPAQLQFRFAIPAGLAGGTFHLQHVCFEPVQGGMSASNGVTVHLR